MAHASEFKKIKILIVEDEPLVAMNMQMEFGKFGYDAFKIISCGADAVQSVKIDKPDLVLMDIRLVGDMNGIETARKIRLFSQIPIIFMTGYSDKHEYEKIKEIRPLGLFDKPVLLSDVSDLIKSAFPK